MDESLPKRERLCGKTAVEALFEHGKTLSGACLRLRYIQREDGNPGVRLLVSVPKRCFKRAVKRNLLKRRIRESFRRQKALAGEGRDLMLVYTRTEILPYEEIFADLTSLLERLP